MDEEFNRLLVREIAAKLRIDERTLLKALRGEKIKTLDAAERAQKGVVEYRERIAAEKGGSA